MVEIWLMGGSPLVLHNRKPSFTNGNIWVKFAKGKYLMNIEWVKLPLF